MKICAKCKKEMQCKKTGLPAVWRVGHCYTGDLFECPICKSEILIITGSSYYDPKIRDRKKPFLDMTPGGQNENN